MTKKEKNIETKETKGNDSPLGPDIHTIKLGEKTYSAESLTEKGTNIINDMRKIDGLMQQQQLLVSVSVLAKGKLIEELTKEAEKFTEVEDPSDKTDK
jgi:hypothetical protein